jgi:hypothetical protein
MVDAKNGEKRHLSCIVEGRADIKVTFCRKSGIDLTRTRS